MNPLHFSLFVVLVSITVSLLILLLCCVHPEDLLALVLVDQKEKFKAIKRTRAFKNRSVSEANEAHRKVTRKLKYRKCGDGKMLSEEVLLHRLCEFEKAIADIFDDALKQIKMSWQKPESERGTSLEADIKTHNKRVAQAYNEYRDWLQKEQMR